MDVKVTDLDGSQKEVFVSISVEDMQPYLKSAALSISQTQTIKGFRKGKAPYEVVELLVGRDTLWRQASIDAVEKTYVKVIKDNDIDPVGRPKVDITKMVAGNDVEFKAIIPTMPSFELPDYKKIAKDVLEKQEAVSSVEVTEHEIQDALEHLKNSRSGNKKDEQSELNDEFARSLGNFKDLDDLKKNVREGMVQEKEQHNKEVKRLRVINAIREKTTMQVSDSLIEEEIDKMEDDLRNRTSALDVSFEDYLKKMGKKIEELRESWRDKAKERVESTFILKEIADKEKIEPKEEDVTEHANKYLSHFESADAAEKKISPDMLKSYIYDMLRNEEVLKFLEDQKSSIIKP